MSDRIDPYLILGVSPTASQAEILHAYRLRLRADHPDTRNQASQGADDRLQQVLAAYAMLRDPDRRADHDRSTARPRRVDIPVTHRATSASTDPISTAPLRAGPVRRHR